jgi:hypothetical protein
MNVDIPGVDQYKSTVFIRFRRCWWAADYYKWIWFNQSDPAGRMLAKIEAEKLAELPEPIAKAIALIDMFPLTNDDRVREGYFMHVSHEVKGLGWRSTTNRVVAYVF